jgi:hypothetical protein
MPKSMIRCRNRQAFDLGLCDDHAIEGIAVKVWEGTDLKSMAQADR